MNEIKLLSAIIIMNLIILGFVVLSHNDIIQYCYSDIIDKDGCLATYQLGLGSIVGVSIFITFAAIIKNNEDDV